jgi:HK97 family phage major capsid protein
MGGSVKDGMPMTLYGRPILLCETAAAVGTKDDICLADLTQYVIGMRRELILDVSNAPGWSGDVVSFRMTLRLDGRPIFRDSIGFLCIEFKKQYSVWVKFACEA